MPVVMTRLRSARRGVLAVGACGAMTAVAGPIGCGTPAYTMQQSVAAAEAFIRGQPFTARVYYDAYGARTPLPAPLDGARVSPVSYRFDADHPLRSILGRRVFVYDLALAMIAHTLAGRDADARSVGTLLAQLIDARGGLVGFSLSLEEPAFYDVDYVRAGTVAWAGYALAMYELVRGDGRFRAQARRAADALMSARVGPGDDPRAGLVLAGRGRWVDNYRRFDGAFVANYCVTEHQIDAWFLFDALARLEGAPYREAADDLSRTILRTLWLRDEGRFAVGVHRHGLDRARALDAAGAWGGLFLLANGQPSKARRALRFTLRHFSARAGEFQGFAPYAGEIPDYEGVDFSRTIFSEGSAGVGILALRLGDRATAVRVTENLRGLQRAGLGGVLYALPEGPDMPMVPAVAPTAWLLFLQRELDGGWPTVFAPAVSAR
jgi:hypothetical protein